MNALLIAIVTSSCLGQSIREQDVKIQNDAFTQWWGTDFNWKFEDLPTEASVAEARIPYSGYIYPDTYGGTVSALRKYDRAYNQNILRATGFEQRDTRMTERTTRTVTRRAGLFGLQTRTEVVTVNAVPHWYGHCNGWSAAAIRHAEPRKSVERNGVVFTPSDIKALLAEIYLYNDIEMLDRKFINPGTLHAVIANWVGRGLHPIAMEADPGKEKWNYPIYAYKCSSVRRSPFDVDVQMNVMYANSSRTESDVSPRLPLRKYFNYRLKLDESGNIVGGWYYRGSSQIDMLWVPLNPKQGGEEGNERGNPHVNVNEVLAIWRDSVSDDLRRNWAVVDPAEEDRLGEVEQLAQLTPSQLPAQPDPDELASEVPEVANDTGGVEAAGP